MNLVAVSPSRACVLPFVNDEHEADQIAPETVQRLFELAARPFGIVIVDAPDGVSPLT